MGKDNWNAMFAAQRLPDLYRVAQLGHVAYR